MTDMIDKVARAIRKEITGRDDTPIEGDGEDGVGLYTDLARAAITAMREPTEQMLIGGAAAGGEAVQNGELWAEPGSVGLVFAAMIDAALNERDRLAIC